MSVSDGPRVPPADRWPAQVQEAFGFLGKLGFQVIDSGTYRLGDWTLLGNGDAGIHLDSDGDTRTVGVMLIRLDDGRLPARWWDGQMVPRVSLGLSGVTELLAPRALIGVSGLPPIEREADRAPTSASGPLSCKPWRRTGCTGTHPGSSLPRGDCAAAMTSERDAACGLGWSVRYGGGMGCCACMGSPTAA